MTNKYLEKIASLAGDVVRSVGRIGKNTAKAVGGQFHKAIGGGFQDHAFNHFGIKDPHKLADITGSGKGLKNFKRVATKGQSFSAKKQTLRDLQPHIDRLKKEQFDARIVSGGIAAGAGYGAVKVKEKFDQPKVDTYNYYQG